MWRSGIQKKRVLYVLLVCVCLACLYWLKNLADINIISDLSFSKYFPLSFLKYENTIYQSRGLVDIEEEFESLLPIPAKWHKLTTPEPTELEVSYENSGNRSSRYIIVTNAGERWWHITYRYAMEVEPGDKFVLGGLLWSKNKGGHAQVQVSAFDDSGNLIKRTMWFIGASTKGEFQQVEDVFVISPGVNLIKLRIAGKGPGQFKFDNLRLRSLELAIPAS
jgi:hypothetical protein